MFCARTNNRAYYYYAFHYLILFFPQNITTDFIPSISL